MKSRSLWVIALFALAAFVRADEPQPKVEPRPRGARPVAVPFRLTDTHHVMVRLKINGKGPFNFIVDTGCPVLIVSTPAAKKAGLTPDAKGWTVLDNLELEGGLAQEKVKCRVETPFQIEGMNAMGLPGVELHGLLGYTVIAKYRMEFDFKRHHLLWTPLAFDPPPPAPLGAGKEAITNLEAMAGLMKVLSFLAGIKPPPPPEPRGFCGFEVAEKDGQVLVERVLAGSAAAEAGLRPGDRIEAAAGEPVMTAHQLLVRTSRLTPGRPLELSVTRNGAKQSLKIITGSGL